MWAMACLFEMQLLDSSDIYRLKLHLCLITFTSYLNCPNSKRSLPFVIIQGYIRVDIWRDQCDRWSCKILVSRVNFQKTPGTAQEFTQN